MWIKAITICYNFVIENCRDQTYWYANQITILGKVFHHVGRNVDLDKLTEKIEGFLTIDGFTEIKTDKNTTDNWIEIQARKGGAGRTLIAGRKAVHIGIVGTPNDFRVTQATGEWGKNIALTLVPIAGLAGVGSLILTARFVGKLWSFVQQSVMELKDTGNEKDGKPTTQNASKKPSSKKQTNQKLEDKASKSENRSNFCENCGNSLKPTAKFCGGCGTKCS